MALTIYDERNKDLRMQDRLKVRLSLSPAQDFVR